MTTQREVAGAPTGAMSGVMSGAHLSVVAGDARGPALATPWPARLRAFRAAHTPQTTMLAGLPWTYLSGGRGPALALLLHGSECDAESLFGAMAQLERQYQVIAPTYPERADSLDTVVAGLAELVTLWGGSCLVVGYSLGGYVAQALAWRRPDLVAGLALCNTGAPAASGARGLWAQYGLFAAAPELLLRWALRAGARLPIWRESPGLASAEAAFWQAYLVEMSSRLTKPQVLAHGRLIEEFHRQRPSPLTLGQAPWASRMLILASERDRVIEPGERDALQAYYPQASTRLFDGVGHLSFITQPETFVGEIARAFSGERA